VESFLAEIIPLIKS